jgi:hypothetical protein
MAGSSPRSAKCQCRPAPPISARLQSGHGSRLRQHSPGVRGGEREGPPAHLTSLTPERAARELEMLLAFEYEFRIANRAPGRPPPLSNPLPGPTLAILLEGKPSPDD